MNRQGDAGFTLIEALVAMVVLALGAVSLLSAAEGNTFRVTEITERTAARWTAQNALLAVQLGEPVTSTEVYGVPFDVRIEKTGTENTSLIAVSVIVSPTNSSSALFVLDGYTFEGQLE